MKNENWWDVTSIQPHSKTTKNLLKIAIWQRSFVSSTNN